MKLFFSPTSPYVKKVLISAYELNLADQIELLPAKTSPVLRDQSVVAKNPLGKIPTLIADDGRALFDSRVICEYLNDTANGQLFPKEQNAKWDAITMQSLGDGLLDAALLARYETFLRPEDRQWKVWESGQLEKIHSALVNFESHTLSGSEFHIGHITLLCALSYLDLRFDYLNWRTSYPKLKAWFEVASQRKSYTKEWALAE
jgi:glutathione S-transferase